jgi:hypothetical protein
VDGARVYAARFIETVLNSSWMMVLLLVPILPRTASYVRRPVRSSSGLGRALWPAS